MQFISHGFQVLALWWRHAVADMRGSRRYFSKESLARIEAGVAASERQHTGQIRVCIESHLPGSDLWRAVRTDLSISELTRQRAQMQFAVQRVWDTEHNNGVLIYLLLAERAIEVVADRGINDHVSPAQWLTLIESMQAAFQRSEFEVGLLNSVATVSALLKPKFPVTAASAGHYNELPDAPQLTGY
jgi:hypothetical protein